jgi:hypothetical protein
MRSKSGLLILIFLACTCATAMGQGQSTVTVRAAATTNPKGNLRSKSSLTSIQGLPDVKLVAPAEIEAGHAVTFKAELSRSFPNLKYRFDFGDGNQTKWQDEPETTYVYQTAGAYRASVDIGLISNGSVKQFGSSPRGLIKVTATVQTHPLSVQLNAGTTSGYVDKAINFTAQTDNRNVTYRFDFGEQGATTDWQASPRARHRYLTPGTYTTRVEVRSEDTSQTATSNAVNIKIRTPRPTVKSSVDLNVGPPSAPLGLPILFQAVAVDSDPKLRYRFNFGDGSSTAWTTDPNQTHSYQQAGRYATFVELARENDELIGVSVRRNIAIIDFTAGGYSRNGGNIIRNAGSNSNSSAPSDSNSNTGGTTSNDNLGTNANSNTPGNQNSNSERNSNQAELTTGNRNASPTPSEAAIAVNENNQRLRGESESSNDWWKYLIVIAIILFGGYQAVSYFLAPTATFVPNLDPGNSKVASGKPFAISMQLDVEPGLNESELKLDTHGGNLIKSERSADE